MEKFKKIVKYILNILTIINALLIGLDPIWNIPYADKIIATLSVVMAVISTYLLGNKAIKNKTVDIEQLGGSGMLFTDFVKTYLGKKTDWDGKYGVQCVDLIDAFIDKCLGLKVGYFGNAKTWWLNRNKSKWLKDNFEFITPSYKNGELKAGDIGIRTSGTYGHIFIVKGATKNGKITYYDQNYNGTGAGMTERKMSYNSSVINGVLRPKDRSKFVVAKVTKPAKAKCICDYVSDNATMVKATKVYADNTRNKEIGSVNKGERVRLLGNGDTNAFIAYGVSKKVYKVGIVYLKDVKKD